MITLSAIPSYVDIPDTDFAVDQPVKASTLTQMAHNAKFAMVRREVFVGVFINGDTIAAPVSPIDGYQYSYAEITFWWTRNFSYDPAAKKPSGSGCIYRWDDSVSSAGVVSLQTQYYIDGGADTVTNDGQVLVVLLCQRNSSLRFSAVPVWADVEDADLARGEALLASNLQQINDNIRYACVRKEFFVQTLYNGQTVTPPVSPVDGYTYQMSELIFQPSMIWTVAQSGSASGGGCIRALGCVVGGMPGISTPAAAGEVASFVNYYANGGAYTPSTDGHVLVLIIGTRAYGNPAIPPATPVQPPSPVANSFGELIIGGEPVSSLVLAAVTGSQRNAAPDSDLKFGFTYWGSGNGVTIANGINGGNAFKLPGGANFTNFSPAYFAVTPGQQITLSAYEDPSAMTNGYTLFGLDWSGRRNTIFELEGAAGSAAGRISATFTVPAGVTQMRLYYGQYASSGTAAGVGYAAQPQVELGAVMTAYKPNFIDDLTGELLYDALSAEVKAIITSGSEIASNAIIEGRSEGIATTVGKLNAEGLLVDADQISADGVTFARIRGAALQDGLVPVAYGKNLVVNPSFEAGGLPAQWPTTPVGAMICPGWQCNYCDPVWQVRVRGGYNQHTGAASLEAVVANNVALAANTTYTMRAYSAPMPVIGGQQYYLAGWRDFASGAAIPSGVTIQQRVGLQWFDANGNVVREDYPPDLTAATNAWGVATLLVSPPSNASSVVVQCSCFIIVGASGVTTSATSSWADLFWDDILFIHAVDLSQEVINALNIANEAEVVQNRTGIVWSCAARMPYVDASNNLQIPSIIIAFRPATNSFCRIQPQSLAVAAWDAVYFPWTANGNATPAAIAYTDANYQATLQSSANEILGTINDDGSKLQFASSWLNTDHFAAMQEVITLLGQIPSSTALNPQGSVLPNSGVPLSTSQGGSAGAYTLTPSTPGASIPRPDGSTLTVGPSTGPTSGALGYSVTAYCFPRINVSTGAVDWQGGYTATPTAAVQNGIFADGYIPAVSDPSTPFLTYTTPASSGGSGSGGSGGGSGYCPADDQLLESLPWLPFTPPKWLKGFVRPARRAKAGGFVRGGDRRWKRIAKAYSAQGFLQYITVGGRTYHTTSNHWWLKPGGDFRAPLPLGAEDQNWIRQNWLFDGAIVAGPHFVMDIGRRHWGLYREIVLEQQPDGDRSILMGDDVTHNFQTI